MSTASSPDARFEVIAHPDRQLGDSVDAPDRWAINGGWTAIGVEWQVGNRRAQVGTAACRLRTVDFGVVVLKRKIEQVAHGRRAR